MLIEFTLKDFVRESNRIERIEQTTQRHVDAHEEFLVGPVSVESLEALVEALQPGAKLRTASWMNVMVGHHHPPQGGPHIRRKLEGILDAPSFMSTAWHQHCSYETLHPFMDGNGRSGRALWLHRMGGIDRVPLGFLQTWYYQTLRNSGARV